jgi:RHS repeat-associated protein
MTRTKHLKTTIQTVAVSMAVLAAGRTANGATDASPVANPVARPEAKATSKAVSAPDSSRLRQARIRPVGDWQVDPIETRYLNSLFQAATVAANSIAPSPQAAGQRWAIDSELRVELENYVATNAASAYAPSLHVWLGHRARQRSAYSLAMDHYSQVWNLLAASSEPSAKAMAQEAGGALAKLLALTGRIEEFDALEAQAAQLALGHPTSSEWRWAREIRTWVTKLPSEAFKCGLYCLDQLGRQTQSGQFLPKNITETESSINGFAAADLLSIGAKAGLRVHAAILANSSGLPVPCVLHLTSGHFVFIREEHGGFYNVVDTVAYGPRWLAASDVLEEASGCVLVSDVVQQPSGVGLRTIDAAAAAAYRGRCHGPTPQDHNDSPPCDPGDPCNCPPGAAGPRPGPPGDPAKPGPKGGPGPSVAGPAPSSAPIPKGTESLPAAGGCSSCGGGMVDFFVSEPYLNVWLTDLPLQYTPAVGRSLDLRLAYHDRSVASIVSGNHYWHGAQLGNYDGSSGAWACSLLSFAELSTDESTVDLMLPAGGWAAFTFPSGSTRSSVDFLHNYWLEKFGPSGGITNLILHYPDGSQTSYGVYDKSDTSFGGVFYMTSQTDPFSNTTTFSYDGNFYLTTVTAADGTTFTLHFDNGSYANAITSVTTSYGATASFTYDALFGAVLTNITDAVGISSWIVYEQVGGGPLRGVVTPYGTLGLSTLLDPGTVFDRTVRITNSIGTQEFYGQINSYIGADWPDFASAQIPTNTPVGTLDTDAAGRQERNTFYWNAQQFAPYVTTDGSTFTWSILKQARIRHWLAATDPTYTHWDSLSAEQAPSPDGSTEGELTFYDYAGKPPGVDYERGTQVMPSVIARVMPDGSTWYQYFIRNTNGLPTRMTESWMGGGSVHTRSDSFVYAANNVDLVGWTNALGVLAMSNVFNAYHQVTTNYDALSQKTTYSYEGGTHQITNASYPSGLTVSYTYNGSHRLQQITNSPVGGAWSFTWNSDGMMYSSTDERGLNVTNFWDGLHRLTGVLYPDGTTSSNRYTRSAAFPNGTGETKILDLTAVKDRLGYWTYFDYDAMRRRTAETNANNVVTRYGYCDCGSVGYVTNAWGTAAEQDIIYTYDNQGNRSVEAYPDGYSVTNWFDSLRRLTAKGDGAANRWFYYDNLNRLTTVSNYYGAERVTSFDVLNRPVYVTDANGVMVTNIYDNLNRLLTRGYPDGGVEKFGYSARGLTSYANQISLTNFFAYDELGRKTYETNANNEILKYTNNAAGDLLSLTDGKSQTTKWNYDLYGRVSNKVDQTGTEILRYTYDAYSRLLSRWSTAKGTTYYTNDPVGNLTSVNYPSSTDVTLQYDWLNRLTNMVDAAGTTKYTYTAGNQLLTEDGPFGSDTVTNTYANRWRTALSVQQPTGTWTNKFVYDLAARLTNVTSQAGAFGYTLGASSTGSRLVKKVLLPNTSYITNTFDSVARLTGTYLDTSGDTVLDSAVYGYNKANQRTTFTNAAGTYYQFSYDNIGQLKVADSSVNAEDRGYLYDAAWNLNWRTNNGTTSKFIVDTKNELTNAFNVPYSFDGNGNLISGTNAHNSYVYDDENRLVQWFYFFFSTNQLSGGDARTDFVYDGLGRLRKRLEYVWNSGGNAPAGPSVPAGWQLTSTAEYVYDGNRVIQERDGNNNPTVAYTRGSDLSATLEGAGGIGGLLGRSHGFSAGNWTNHNFYHADGNGNITYLANNSQALAASYRYDPYGNTMSSSGTLASANVYRFSSKEIHVASGMYYYLYRFYDPNLQRWINRDPIADLGFQSIKTRTTGRFHSRGWPLYPYAFNSPMRFFDAFGLAAQGGPVIEPPTLPPSLGGGGNGPLCAALAAAAIAAWAAAAANPNDINLAITAGELSAAFEAAGCGNDIAPPPKMCPRKPDGPKPPSKWPGIIREIIDRVPVIIILDPCIMYPFLPGCDGGGPGGPWA